MADWQFNGKTYTITKMNLATLRAVVRVQARVKADGLPDTVANLEVFDVMAKGALKQHGFTPEQVDAFSVDEIKSLGLALRDANAQPGGADFPKSAP